MSGRGSSGTIGLVKNDPTDQVSRSSASSTMPLPARSFSTVSRACCNGTRPPVSTPS
jgi:hypothetical protein